MKNRLAVKLFSLGIIISSVFQPNATQAESHRNIYSCVEKKGIPVTVVDTYEGRAELIAWKSSYIRNSAWTPQKRCQEVSVKLQEISDAKQLKYMTTGEVRGYPVICVGKITPQGLSCKVDNLLMVLAKGDNPNEVLADLLKEANQIIISANSRPITASEQYVFDINKYLAIYPYPESFTDNRSNRTPLQSNEKVVPSPSSQPSSDCESTNLFCNTTIVKNTPTTTMPNRDTYSCINNDGKPLTVVDTSRGRIELIVWESNYFRASGWTPDKRCQEVTKRFQRFSDDNKLTYITTGQMNGYPVICVGKIQPPQGYSCLDDSLLITLQKGENSNQVLESLFRQASQRSGGGTPVSRSPEGKSVFNIKNYLAEYPYSNSSLNKHNSDQIVTETSSSPQPVQKRQSPQETCPPLFCTN